MWCYFLKKIDNFLFFVLISGFAKVADGRARFVIFARCTQMYLFMSPYVADCWKPTHTMFTFVWFFMCVSSSFMFCAIAWWHKTFLAVVAFVWFYSEMTSNVINQSGSTVKSTGTYCTSMGFRVFLHCCEMTKTIENVYFFFSIIFILVNYIMPRQRLGL